MPGEIKLIILEQNPYTIMFSLGDVRVFLTTLNDDNDDFALRAWHFLKFFLMKNKNY